MRWKWMITGLFAVIVGLVVTVYAILGTYNYNSLKPQIAQAFKAATGRELTLGGAVKLQIGFAPTLVVENVGLQNAAWGSQPQMATIKRFELQAALLPLIFGNVEVKRLILVDPDILIETNPAGKSNLDFPATGKPARVKQGAPKKGKVALTINELSIQNGRITYRNGKSGKTWVGTVDNLVATATGADSPVKLKLKGSYQGEPFEGSGTLIPLASLTGTSGKPWPVDLTMKAGSAELTLDGTIRNVPELQGIDLKFKASSKDLQQMNRLAGEPLPLQGSFAASGRVTDPGPKVYRISDLKANVDDSDLAGSAQLNLSKKRPLVTATLSANKLDLRPFLQNPGRQGTAKSKTKAKARSVAAKRGKIFSNRPLPLDRLQKVDAQLKLQAQELLLQRLAFRNFSVDVALKNGNLTVKPLAAVIGGGVLNGHFNLQSIGKDARMETAITIDHLDAAVMLQQLAVTNALQGRIDADINAASRGSSVADWMARLNGKVVLLMANGRINNKYAGLLGSDFGTNVFRLINPNHKAEPYTKIECFVGGFNIRNGIAETTALAVNTNTMSVIGDGKIDLRTERLDLKLNPIPKQGLGTNLTGKLNVSLGQLARPFKLAGTLAHPSLALDLTQTGIAIGKALGGLLTVGPAGIGGALTGQSAEVKNLCPLAVEAARQGVKLSVIEKRQKPRNAVGTTTEGVKKSAGEIGKQLMNLFGK